MSLSSSFPFSSLSPIPTSSTSIPASPLPFSYQRSISTSLLQHFYKNQVLFLTGASGFVGKVFLSQLLLNCECKRIYILLRSTRKKSIHQRLYEDIFSNSIFDELRQKIINSNKKKKKRITKVQNNQEARKDSIGDRTKNNDRWGNSFQSRNNQQENNSTFCTSSKKAEDNNEEPAINNSDEKNEATDATDHDEDSHSICGGDDDDDFSYFLKYIKKKIIPVEGNLQEPFLGFKHIAVMATNKNNDRNRDNNNDDYNYSLEMRMMNEITMIVHVAASVHFTMPMKDNFSSNVVGTINVICFAKMCKNLQVFVHTSTCYVNSDTPGRVQETAIPLPYDVDTLIHVVQMLVYLQKNKQVRDIDRNDMEKELLEKFPNTYTFTKRLCENLLIRQWFRDPINQNRKVDNNSNSNNDNSNSSDTETKWRPHFPLCVIRPSIVGCVYRHPVRGWLDNLNATGGILLLCALGILKCLPVNPQLTGDQVPVDTVADSLIIGGAVVALSRGIEVYMQFPHVLQQLKLAKHLRENHDFLRDNHDFSIAGNDNDRGMHCDINEDDISASAKIGLYECVEYLLMLKEKKNVNFNTYLPNSMQYITPETQKLRPPPYFEKYRAFIEKNKKARKEIDQGVQKLLSFEYSDQKECKKFMLSSLGLYTQDTNERLARILHNHTNIINKTQFDNSHKNDACTMTTTTINNNHTNNDAIIDVLSRCEMENCLLKLTRMGVPEFGTKNKLDNTPPYFKNLALPNDKGVSRLMSTIKIQTLQDADNVYKHIPPPKVYIIHSCTSDINPCEWGNLLKYGQEYNLLHPYENRISRNLSSPYFEESFDSFKRIFFMNQKLPASILNNVTTFFLPQNSKIKKYTDVFVDGLRKAEKAAEAFHLFAYQEWIFEQKNLPRLLSFLSINDIYDCGDNANSSNSCVSANIDDCRRSSIDCFFLNVKDINWREFIHLSFYGIARWILKETSASAPPKAPLMYIDAMKKHLLHDDKPSSLKTFFVPLRSNLNFYLSSTKTKSGPESSAIKHSVFGCSDVHTVIESYVQFRSKNPQKRHEKSLSQLELEEMTRKEVINMYRSIETLLKPSSVSILSVLFHRLFSNCFDRIVVEETEINILKKSIQTSQKPVIFLPAHKSYMDFLILGYICFVFEIPLPYICADTRFQQLNIVSRIFRNCGVIFLKQALIESYYYDCKYGNESLKNLNDGDIFYSETKKNKVYSILLKNYLKSVAKYHRVLEIFIEGGRTKTGLLLPPRMELFSLLVRDSSVNLVKDINEMVEKNASKKNANFPLDVFNRMNKNNIDEVLVNDNKVDLSTPNNINNTEKKTKEICIDLEKYDEFLFIPLSFSYDKTVEVETFVDDLLGEEERRYLSFSRIFDLKKNVWGVSSHPNNLPIPATPSVHPNYPPPQFVGGTCPFGSAYFSVNTPITFSEYLRIYAEELRKKELQKKKMIYFDSESLNEKNCHLEPSTLIQLTPEHIIEGFGKYLIDRISDTLTITPTVIVATILSMNREGIREIDLMNQVCWLREEIIKREGKISPAVSGFMYDVRNVVYNCLYKYMCNFLECHIDGWCLNTSDDLRKIINNNNNNDSMNSNRLLKFFDIFSLNNGNNRNNSNGYIYKHNHYYEPIKNNNNTSNIVSRSTTLPTSNLFYRHYVNNNNSNNNKNKCPNDNSRSCSVNNNNNQSSNDNNNANVIPPNLDNDIYNKSLLERVNNHYLLNELRLKKKVINDCNINNSKYISNLLISYYRNQCLHLFINESYMCLSLYSFGTSLPWKNGVEENTLIDRILFLSSLFKNHFQYPHHFTQQNARRLLDRATNRGVFRRKESTKKNYSFNLNKENNKDDNNDDNINKYKNNDNINIVRCNYTYFFNPENINVIILLQHLISPFVDTYFAVILSLLSLLPQSLLIHFSIHTDFSNLFDYELNVSNNNYSYVNNNDMTFRNSIYTTNAHSMINDHDTNKNNDNCNENTSELYCSILNEYVGSPFYSKINLNGTNHNKHPPIYISNVVPKYELISRAYWIAHSLLKKKVFRYYESASFLALRAAIDGIIKNKIIEVVPFDQFIPENVYTDANISSIVMSTGFTNSEPNDYLFYRLSPRFLSQNNIKKLIKQVHMYRQSIPLERFIIGNTLRCQMLANMPMSCRL